MSHLYLSAAHKSSGKTMLSIGLCAALRASGEVVQAFKKGPDYIDPLWLEQATGRPCYNLDYNTMRADEISAVFASRMVGADIGLIEGNKGLFDGVAVDGRDSNAALATQLDAPVVLVLDTQGITRGVAPLILGYLAFDDSLRIAGVILNQVAGARHESKLRAVIERYTDVTLLGAVRRSGQMRIDERHMGLVPSNEWSDSASQIAAIAAQVDDQVDLDALREIATSAAPIAATKPPSVTPNRPSRLRIGIARDAAFGFYYADDLEALEKAGAELVPFSPLRDSTLPACDALFLGGGFPETHIEGLTANEPLRRSIVEFVASDRPVYAECGGLMYLCQRLTWGSKTGKMCGVIPAEVVMHDTPQGRGYVRLRETDDHPWPGARSGGGAIAAHEFHYSSISTLPAGYSYAYEVERGQGLDGEHDGILYRNVLANYAHLRDTQAYPWARRFVEFIGECLTRST